MAHVAAVLGAIGAPLLLVPSRRALVLGGARALALAEVVLAIVRATSGISPARAAPRRVGLAAWLVLLRRSSSAVPDSSRSRSSSRRRSGCRSTSAAAHRFYVGLPKGDRPPAAAVRLIAAAALALAWRLVRGASRLRRCPADRVPARGARLLRRPLRSLVVGRRAAASEPPPVLPLPLRAPRRRGRALAVPGLDAACPRLAAVALAALFATVGLVEEATAAADLLHAVGPDRERVLELLPRHLAVPRPEPVRAPRSCSRSRSCSRPLVPEASGSRCGDRIIGFLFAGLFFSYSQSSLVALFAVAVFISVVAGDRAVRLIAAATAGRRARGRGRVRGRQGRGRLDPAGDQRPLAADRPDGEGGRHHPLVASVSAPSRGRARRSPGTAAPRVSSSRTRRRSRSLRSSA